MGVPLGQCGKVHALSDLPTEASRLQGSLPPLY